MDPAGEHAAREYVRLMYEDAIRSLRAFSRVGVTLTEEDREVIRHMTIEEEQNETAQSQRGSGVSDIKLPARRTWRIEGMALDAADQAYPVGAQYSMLESECATYVEAGNDPDDMIKEAALDILTKVLERNGWRMLTWAWFNNEL